MQLTRRQMVLASAALPLATVLPGLARADQPELFAPGGLAISGYDPVIYLKEGQARAGRGNHAVMWRGAKWLFASPDTMEAFEMNPTRYLPHYGGYCAYAMAKGAVAPTDPLAFTIWEDRLYLNYSLEVRTLWRQNIPEYVRLADGHWPAALRAS